MRKIFCALTMMFIIGATNAQNGVVISGVTWATHNVGEPGKFVENIWDNGNYYAHDQVQNACPEGWRFPTAEEFESLIKVGSVWASVNGVNGRIFGSGDNTVFFPAAGSAMPPRGKKNAAKPPRVLKNVGRDGYYWTPTYILNFNYLWVTIGGNISGGILFPVRCVAK